MKQLLVSSLFKKDEKKRLVAWFAALSLVTLSCLLWVRIRIEQRQCGYEIARLEKERLLLEQEVRALQLEVAFLKRADRIFPLAEKKLFLKKPSLADVF